MQRAEGDIQITGVVLQGITRLLLPMRAGWTDEEIEQGHPEGGGYGGGMGGGVAMDDLLAAMFAQQYGGGGFPGGGGGFPGMGGGHYGRRPF